MPVTLVNTTSGSNSNLTNGSNLTITKPSGVVQNDLLIAICGMNATATSWALPSGWTQQLAFRGNGEELTVWYKVAGASEGASYNFTVTSAGALDGGFGMIALRGADTTTPILANSAEFDQGGASTSMTANSVSWTGAADAISLIFMTWQSSAATVTWPSGWDNTTNGWTSNDGFEWSAVGCNLTTQSAVTSLPAKTNPPTLSVAEFGQCGQLAIKVAAAAAASPPQIFYGYGPN